MEALTGLSAGIEMRKKKQSSFCDRIAQRPIVFSKNVDIPDAGCFSKRGVDENIR